MYHSRTSTQSSASYPVLLVVHVDLFVLRARQCERARVTSGVASARGHHVRLHLASTWIRSKQQHATAAHECMLATSAPLRTASPGPGLKQGCVDPRCRCRCRCRGAAGSGSPVTSRAGPRVLNGSVDAAAVPAACGPRVAGRNPRCPCRLPPTAQGDASRVMHGPGHGADQQRQMHNSIRLVPCAVRRRAPEAATATLHCSLPTCVRVRAWR